MNDRPGQPMPPRLPILPPEVAETEQLVGAGAADEIGEILQRVQTKMSAPMTVEIHTLKALLDGQEAAASSPFAR